MGRGGARARAADGHREAAGRQSALSGRVKQTTVARREHRDPPPLEALRHGPEPARVGNVGIGTASWTERTLLESRSFYPSTVRNPEQRLGYYARHFPVVEVDSSYYAVPAPKTAEAWARRTPDDFLFGVK